MKLHSQFQASVSKWRFKTIINGCKYIYFLSHPFQNYNDILLIFWWQFVSDYKHDRRKHSLNAAGRSHVLRMMLATFNMGNAQCDQIDVMTYFSIAILKLNSITKNIFRPIIARSSFLSTAKAWTSLYSACRSPPGCPCAPRALRTRSSRRRRRHAGRWHRCVTFKLPD